MQVSDQIMKLAGTIERSDMELSVQRKTMVIYLLIYLLTHSQCSLW